MFNLIITIISIALVAVLAIASIYYGGSAFNQGSAKAAAATMVNQAQQIAGANTLFMADTGALAANMAALVATTEYLAATPKSPNADAYALSATNIVTAANVSSAEICLEVNKTAGVTVTPATTALVTTQYGCSTEGLVGDGIITFVFKG